MPELDAFETRFASAYRWYLTEVPTDVDATAVAHAIAAAHPRHHWPNLSMPLGRAVGSRPAVVLLVVALVGALIGGLLYVGARWFEAQPPLPRDAAALDPTGVDWVTAATGSYERLVTDGEGVLWARGAYGRLVRVDPASGSERAWTVADDAAFATMKIVPAQTGGVWLVHGRTLRLFDGDHFREVVSAPADIAVAVEASDGDLWAASTDGTVLRWDRTSWTALDPVQPSGNGVIGMIAVDGAGNVWIDGPGSRLSRHDGRTWTTFDATDSTTIGSRVSAIVDLPGRGIWVAADFGLARFDGSAWTDLLAEFSGNDAIGSVAQGPDGAVWIGERDSATVRRFDGRSWASYGPAAGLPSNGTTASLAVAKGGLYVGTGEGIFRLAGDRWERVTGPAQGAIVDSRGLVAVSRDELWSAGDAGVWHLDGGTWTNESVGEPRGVVADLTIAPDGTLWAAGEAGIAYRRDGRWTLVDGGQARAILVDRSGTAWLEAVTPQYIGGWTCDIVTLRFEGATWVRRAVARCPESFLAGPYPVGPSPLAIDRDGVLWADGQGWGSPTLGRYDGHAFETIGAIAGEGTFPGTIVGTTQTGDLWVEVTTGEPFGTARGFARYDGTAWTMVPTPEGSASVASTTTIAPDGTLWTVLSSSSSSSSSPMLAHYDGQRWTYPYAWVSLPYLSLIAVAPDGTVFAYVGTGILRLPAQPPGS